MLAVSGVAVAATPFAVRAAGSIEGGSLLLVVVAGLGIMIPGTMLAAVTPMVTKLRLTSLTQTGRVVGRLSGIGTVGAIVGTVLTGFVLISRVPVSGIMVGLGHRPGGRCGGGRASGSRLGARPPFRPRWWCSAGSEPGLAPGGCDVETAYHCAVVITDHERPSGRVLLLDGAPHSYVDLADPTYLEFSYAQAVASVIDTAYPPGRPLRAYHLGAGALTLPRYLTAVRPGTTNVVSEIDPGVVAVDRDRLALTADPGLDLRVEDGRLGLRRLGTGSQDLVIGDAFGGISVPWHLTTREAVQDVRRVLADDGTYVVNMIDRGPLGFARAELATLDEQFGYVALAAKPETVARTDGGNLVAIASDAPIDLPAIAGRLAERGTAGR